MEPPDSRRYGGPADATNGHLISSVLTNKVFEWAMHTLHRKAGAVIICTSPPVLRADD